MERPYDKKFESVFGPWTPERAAMAKKEQRIQIRITPQLKEAAQIAADTQGRTLSNYIAWLIEKDTSKPKQS